MLFGRKRDNVKGIPDTTWKKLEHITLSERSQSQKAVHCMIALTCSVQKGCPDWESNWRHFGSQAGAQTTEPHKLRAQGLFLG